MITSGETNPIYWVVTLIKLISISFGSSQEIEMNSSGWKVKPNSTERELHSKDLRIPPRTFQSSLAFAIGILLYYLLCCFACWWYAQTHHRLYEPNNIPMSTGMVIYQMAFAGMWLFWVLAWVLCLVSAFFTAIFGICTGQSGSGPHINTSFDTGVDKLLKSQHADYVKSQHVDYDGGGPI